MLIGCYPNPFNSHTVIRFSLPERNDVSLSVYDLLGRELIILAQGEWEAGTHLLHWDGRDRQGRLLPSAVYLYRLRAGGRIQTRKLLVLK